VTHLIEKSKLFCELFHVLTLVAGLSSY